MKTIVKTPDCKVLTTTHSDQSFQPWTLDRLKYMRALALGHQPTYGPALHSYLNFCRLHHFATEPTVDTISFFIVYMSCDIEPPLLASYLADIQTQLEPIFSNIRTVCRSTIVTRTLRGCKKMRREELAKCSNSKQPLPAADIQRVVETLRHSKNHEDLLFVAQLVVGFVALHPLEELVWPDDTKLQSYFHVPFRHVVEWVENGFVYYLPKDKVDGTWSTKGDRIVVRPPSTSVVNVNPVTIFKNYLNSRDTLFPGAPFLWLKKDGTIPTRSWFLQRLHTFFPDSISGCSIRAGGAVALARAGVSSDRIQDIGRWTNEKFKIYIRKNPVLMQSLIMSRPAFESVFH